MNVSDDEQLMLAAARGDREAFGSLVERHHPGVLRFVHRFLGIVDGHTAEDLAQDVFLAAWKAAPSFRPQAKVLTWLLRITTNICLNHRRRRRLRAMVPLDTPGPLSTQKREANPRSEAERPDTRELAREQAEMVSKAIADLPEKQRAAILLRHFHGLNYAEIADVLGTSVSAVQSLLFRARQSLWRLLTASETDMAAVSTRLDKIASLQRQVQQCVVDHLLEEKEILGPEQQQAFNEIIRRRVCACGTHGPEPLSGSRRGHDTSEQQPEGTDIRKDRH